MAFVVLFLLAKTGDAQLSTASVNGVVLDSSGAVVPNATIKLRNVATSVETITASNSTGSYAIVSITPGQYTLDASAKSFSTEHIDAFTLTVGQTASIDFALAAGIETRS